MRVVRFLSVDVLSRAMLTRLALLLVTSLAHGALLTRPLTPHASSPRAAATSVDESRPLNVRAARRTGAVLMAEATSVADGVETFEFEAEVAKVMDIIINSLYSDKDIVRAAARTAA